MTPVEDLHALVAKLNATPEPDPDLISEVGVGELENLIRGHGQELWPEVERLARSDQRFRRALSSVWAYDSPEYERRTQLLEELDEFHTVRVSFVIEPDDFAGVPRMSWRAVELEGEPPGHQLGRLLREIADWYEREPLRDNPEVVKNRAIQQHYFDWSDAAGAVERLWHEVAVAPDLDALKAVVRRANGIKQAEQEAWRLVVGAVEAR